MSRCRFLVSFGFHPGEESERGFVLTRSKIMSDRKFTYWSNVAVLAMAVIAVAFSGCRPVSNTDRGPFGFPTARLFGNRDNRLASQPPSRLFPNLTSRANPGQNPWAAGGANNGSTSTLGSGVNPAAGNPAIASEFQDLNQRLTAYDSDNQLLNTELAALKQKLGLANQYSQTLKQQLADTEQRARQAESAHQNMAQQLAQASTRIEQLNQEVANANSNAASRFASTRGAVPAQLPGATLNANNSLARRLGDIQIPGGMARLDGDVIRIEFPSDRMFVPNSTQIVPAQLPQLQSVVGTIRQNFPRQIVGIEAHWDRTPTPNMSHHQLTSSQALAMFDRLVSMGVPDNQLFIMGMGSNRPRHQQQVANGIHPNRRIELVIYPETFN